MTADEFTALLERFASEQYAVGVASTRGDPPVARGFAEQRAATYRAALITAYTNAHRKQAQP